MKTFLIKSFLFAFLFAVFFILINIIYLGIIVSTDWDFRNRLESLRFDNPDYMVLALGASTALDGFDTELLTRNGFKSYNLSMGGTTIRSNYIQLDEYLTKSVKKPEYVLLGLFSTHEIFDKEKIHPIIEVTMKGHNFNLNDVPILKFKWLGFEFLKKTVSSKHRKAKLVSGQLKFQKIVHDNTNYKTNYLDISKFESSYWIGEIARLCGQNGINLIIVEMPGFRDTQNLSDRGPYKIHFKNGYSTKLYNLNSRKFCEVIDPNKDWIGNSHLNEFGAVKFTEELIKILRE